MKNKRIVDNHLGKRGVKVSFWKVSFPTLTMMCTIFFRSCFEIEPERAWCLFLPALLCSPKRCWYSPLITSFLKHEEKISAWLTLLFWTHCFSFGHIVCFENDTFNQYFWRKFLLQSQMTNWCTNMRNALLKLVCTFCAPWRNSCLVPLVFKKGTSWPFLTFLL